jgi:hypothetical protein
MTKIKTRHFPPQHCGYCEETHDSATCKRPPKTHHLVEHCTYDMCVEGWWDYFDENMIYLMTKPCPVCLPNTYDYVNDYPLNSNKLDSKGRMLGRSLSVQRRMQEARTKKLMIANPEPIRGKKK